MTIYVAKLVRAAGNNRKRLRMKRLANTVMRTSGPLLLGSHKYNRLTELEVEGLPEHADEEQVKLDVDRSFVYYPNSMPFYTLFASHFFITLN